MNARDAFLMPVGRANPKGHTSALSRHHLAPLPRFGHLNHWYGSDREMNFPHILTFSHGKIEAAILHIGHVGVRRRA